MTTWQRICEMRWFILALTVAVALVLIGTLSLNERMTTNAKGIQRNAVSIELIANELADEDCGR